MLVAVEVLRVEDDVGTDDGERQEVLRASMNGGNGNKKQTRRSNKRDPLVNPTSRCFDNQTSRRRGVTFEVKERFSLELLQEVSSFWGGWWSESIVLVQTTSCVGTGSTSQRLLRCQTSVWFSSTMLTMRRFILVNAWTFAVIHCWGELHRRINKNNVFLLFCLYSIATQAHSRQRQYFC